MDAIQNVRTDNVGSPQPAVRSAYRKVLLSMQPGDSFSIPKDRRLRSNILRIARYLRIPTTSRSTSDNEIRIWRVGDKPIEPRPIAVNKGVPLPVKLTSAVEIARQREAKARSVRQNAGDRIQEVELVNNERHTITLVIAEKKPAVLASVFTPKVLTVAGPARVYGGHRENQDRRGD